MLSIGKAGMTWLIASLIAGILDRYWKLAVLVDPGRRGDMMAANTAFRWFGGSLGSIVN